MSEAGGGGAARGGDRLRLAIFDMDGTLLDSGDVICAAMRSAFEGPANADGLPAPSDAAIRRIVGLELYEAVRRLAPEGAAPEQIGALGDAYRQAFIDARAAGGGEGAAPLYPGARACIERLRRDETLLLSVATGKARRGLDHTLSAHGLEGVFIATQTCSENPGKPHPGMIESCLAATGVAAADAVMIGDTVFDMEMAANAGVAAIGVAWGYHAAEELADAGAREIVSDFDALGRALEALWR